MFIKVCRKDYNSIFECDRLHIRHPEDLDVQIDLERDDTDSSVSLCFTKEDRGIRVYVMNDKGQTIEYIYGSRDQLEK